MGTRRVLLLGASGFLGRSVAGAFTADPRVAAVLRVGSSVPVDSPPDGWVRHDLMAGTPDGLVELLRSTEPDVVVNCVGKLNGSEEALAVANVVVTARLVDALVAYSPWTRLVSIGSAAEYGVVTRGTPVAEDAPTRPIGSYGITKLAATQLISCAAMAERVDGVVLRVFNPIGPGVPAESLLGRAAESIRWAMETSQDVVTLGPLDAYRDFVDVRDVAEAVREAALVDKVSDRVLNVGSGTATSIRDAVGRLVQISGFVGRIAESDPAPARSAAVDWIAADIVRIRQRLGWSPSRDLDDSLKAVWAPVR